jgi:glycolate oxidase iron-sulfur subunit
MAAVAEGIADVDATFAELMGFCLQCRACETACPSLVPFGRAMEGARVEVAAQLGGPASRLRRIVTGRAIASPALVTGATWGARLLRRTSLGKGDGPLGSVRGLRPSAGIGEPTRGRSWPALGSPRGKIGLLSGCVMDPWFGPVHEATVAVLRAAGYDVEAPFEQTCCGALAAHDGAGASAQRMAARNVAAFDGYDVVVADAAGCGAHLKAYGHWAAGGDALAERTRDVTELVAGLIDEGALPEIPTSGHRVGVQDPCHLRHGQKITAAPRRVVEAAGYEVVDVDPSGQCCGAAGMYTVTHPETSAALGRVKAEQVAATDVAIVASANPGCEIQLRSYVRSAVRIVHPIELYAERLGDE